MEHYLPWYCATGFAILMVTGRILSNRYFIHSAFGIPGWVSALYSVSFWGLIVAALGSMFVIAWWAFIPVLVIYGLTCLVPDALVEATRGMSSAQVKAAFDMAREAAQDPNIPFSLPSVRRKMN